MDSEGSPVPAADRPSVDGAESITRNASFALASQIVTAAFTAALTIFLARELGPEQFGVFSLAVGVGAVLVLPGDAGISGAAARYIAERRGNNPTVAAVLRDASRLRLLTSGAVMIGLILTADLLANAYDEPDLAWTLRGMALAIFGQNLLQLYSGAFTALGRLSLSFRSNVMKSVVEMGASVGLVLAGAGAVGAAFGRAAGFLAGGMLGMWLMLRLVGRARRGQSSGVGRRQLAGYAGALALIEGSFVLFEQIDVLLIGALLTATAAGLFQAPLRLVTFLHYPAYALAAGIAPRLARHEVREPAVEPFLRGMRILVVTQALIVAPIVVWADPIVDTLLGSEYAESEEVLRAMAPAIFLAGLAPLVSMSVNYLGEAPRRIPIALGALGINIVIDLVFIPKIGIVAGAIGTNVAYGIYVPGHLLICRRLLNVPLRPVLITTVRCLAAAALTGGLLALYGTEDVSILAMIAGGILASIFYVATLIALREITPAEVRGLLAGVRSRAIGLVR